MLLSRKRLMVLGIALLLILSACQPVDGFDVNKALLGGIQLESYEGAGHMTVELILTEHAGVQESALLQALNKITLQFPDVKVQDRQTMSMYGELVLPQASIPIGLYLAGDRMLLEVEGAVKPFEISAGLEAAGAAGIAGGMGDMQNMLLGNPELMLKLLSYVIEKLPNPQVLSVEPAVQTINGEELQLNKISAVISGSEILPLARELAVSILEDEEGFKELVKELVDIFMPVTGGSGGLIDPNLLKNIAVESFYGEIRIMLEDFVENYDVFADSLLFGFNPLLSFLFSDETKLAVDLYVDDSFMTRQSDFELVLALGLDEMGLEGVKIEGSFSFWSLNGPVTAVPVEASGGTLNLEELASLPEFLGNLERDSALFKLLKDDLQLSKREIGMQVASSGEVSAGAPQPFVKPPGHTMVPVRFVSESLSALVEWNQDTFEVTVTDVWSGNTVVLAIDSRIALVNGQEVELETEAELINGSTYVPIRIIAEALGGVVGWEQNGDLITVSIIID